ncbi:hypothetical protein IIA15_04890 [candidate division TA06 bacterium]|nr:hypothetical protein [candidate division TA06 bacterium]
MWTRIIFLCLLHTTYYLLPAISIAQINFERTYGDTSNDQGNSVQQTSDGGYIVAGNTSSFGAGSDDVYLIKTDSLGDTLWTKTYGGTLSDVGTSVQQTSDGGYIIAGYTNSFGAGLFDVYLIKTDSLGDTLWTQTIGDTSNDYGNFVRQTSDGGYVIAGFSNSFGPGDADVYLIRTDSLGDTLWTRTYGGISTDIGYSVQETQDGGYIVTGNFGAGSAFVYLIKTDSLGDTLWTKTYGGINTDVGRSVQETPDGGYIITGSTSSIGAGSNDVYLIKTDSLGDTLWTRTYGGTNSDEGLSVDLLSDGGYVIGGSTNSFGLGLSDVYLVRTDSLGNLVCMSTFGDTASDWGRSIQLTFDGGYILTGWTDSYGVGMFDVYLIKTVRCGGVGVEETEPDLGEYRISILEFRLFQNQPNPFYHSTTISYSLPAFSDQQSAFSRELKIPVRLDVYDITGRLVEMLVNERQEPGVYKVQWEGKDQASGIYFYRLEARIGQTGDFVRTKKMILLH